MSPENDKKLNANRCCSQVIDGGFDMNQLSIPNGTLLQFILCLFFFFLFCGNCVIYVWRTHLNLNGFNVRASFVDVVGGRIHSNCVDPILFCRQMENHQSMLGFCFVGKQILANFIIYFPFVTQIFLTRQKTRMTNVNDDEHLNSLRWQNVRVAWLAKSKWLYFKNWVLCSRILIKQFIWFSITELFHHHIRAHAHTDTKKSSIPSVLQ